MSGGHKLVAYLWMCGDDCECVQPHIDIVSRTRHGTGCVSSTVWEGEFTSGDYGRLESQERELTEAAARYGIQLNDDSPFGELPISDDRAAEFRSGGA